MSVTKMPRSADRVSNNVMTSEEVMSWKYTASMEQWEGRVSCYRTLAGYRNVGLGALYYGLCNVDPRRNLGKYVKRRGLSSAFWMRCMGIALAVAR